MGDVEGLPGIREQHRERIVLHVDNDCFYAACERLREPELLGEPVIVGMGFEPGEGGGAVATASYEARAHGVESAQPISEAMEKLPPIGSADAEAGPHAHYRPVDMAYYQEKAVEVKAILREYADVVREVSIDEAYLDCTERTTWDGADEFADRLKSRIAADVGLPVSVGVAPNMSVAKIASDHDKPDGRVVVRPEAVDAFLAPLPLEALHGIGPVTAGALHDLGMERVADIAEADLETLVDGFGERGRELHRRARGVDPREVTPRGDPKSLSRETSIDTSSSDPDRLRDRVVALAEAVAERATERGATYRTIGIKVVTPPFDVQTRERSLPGPVDDATLVVEVAIELLEEFEDEQIRKVGVRVSNLSFAEGDQTDLAAWPTGDGDPDDNARDAVDCGRAGRGQARLTEYDEPG